MKIKFLSALDGAPKLLTSITLSALLVACGGGSGDETDSTAGTETAGTETAGTEGTETAGFGDLDLDPDSTDGDTGGDTDGDIIAPIADLDNDGISDEDEDTPCKGRPGTDDASRNALWNDNCQLQYFSDFAPQIEGNQNGPFYNSTYSLGVQRILYCRGHAGVVDSIDDFADGFFGPNTDTAVKAFQKAEGRQI